MKKLLFIINPIAGRKNGDIPSLADKVLTDMEKHYVVTDQAGHASVIARDAIGKGYDAIVAVGGDGTLNEVAKELVHTKERLGLIPTGSGNGFASHLKVPLSPRRALLALKRNDFFACDVGRINQSYFLTTCGFGFDAKVAHAFALSDRRGFDSYVSSAWKEYLGFKPRTYQFTVDGRELERKAFIITLANANQYGNMARIAPEARLDSGILVCCVVRSFKPVSAPLLALQLLTGTLPMNRHYEQFPCKSFTLKNYAGPYHIDGEPLHLDHGTVDIEVLPGALQVLGRLPAKRVAKPIKTGRKSPVLLPGLSPRIGHKNSNRKRIISL